MEIDGKGMVTLIDRDTGREHKCSPASAREILEVATLAVDGELRYIYPEDYDGVIAKPAKSSGKPKDPAGS